MLKDILIDGNGTFVFTEYKYVGTAQDVSASILKTTDNGRQLTESWLRSAIDRTPNLNSQQKVQLENAIDAKNVRTQLVVIKPTRTGSGLNKKFSTHKDFGKNAKDKIHDIVIIELGLD